MRDEVLRLDECEIISTKNRLSSCSTKIDIFLQNFSGEFVS